MRLIVALSLLALAVDARFLKECFNTPDGLYPLGPCEPNFLTCSGGIARVMDCPADLIYREDGEFCDWKENVVGCGDAGDIYGADNRQSDEASGDSYSVGADQPVEASGDVYTSSPSTETTEELNQEASADVASDAPASEYDYTSTAEPSTTTSSLETYSQPGSEEHIPTEIDRASAPEENSGSVPEPVNVCENREDGTYSDGSCTTLYHICTGNAARFVNCPTPLFYDSVHQKCSWGTHIEACHYQTSARDEPSHDQSGDGSGETEASCDGKADGIYPNGVCSTDFLTCSGGIARVMNCPASLVFNPSIHVCDWPRDVAECSGQSTPRTVCEEDGYFSFGQCSSSFTACTNGRAIVMFCPAGLKFAESTQRCEYEADAAECQTSSDQPSVTTTRAYYGQSEDVPVPLAKPVHERASDEASSTSAEVVYEPAVAETTVTTPEATYEPVSEETAAPTTEGYEQTDEDVPLTTTVTPASDEPSTYTTVETVAPTTETYEPVTEEPSTTTTVYEEPTEEISQPASDEPSTTSTVYEEPSEETTESVSEEPSTTTTVYEEPTEGTTEPASDEPSTTTTVYEEPTEGTSAPTTEPASDEPSTTTTLYEEPTEETSEPTSEEPSTTTTVYEEPSEERAADEVSTTPAASYNQSSEKASSAAAADEGSGTEQNACTGLADGFYSVGCSPSALSCRNGKESSFVCPSHLVFNEETSICDYPQTSLKCQYQEQPVEDVPAVPFQCSSDGLFSDSLCSASYHQCSAGHLINFTCAETNAVFSAAEATCVDQSTLLQCKSLTSPY